MRSDHVNSVPVTIVTGFLGSGKTTVLNRLLRAPDLADTAVIINEFGEVSLDHLLIEQAIETAGLAAPAPVVHTLNDTNQLCHLDGVVVTVDAVHALSQLREREEARNQL